MELNPHELMDMYAWMLRIRYLEETCLRLYDAGEPLADFINPCIGQEGVTVGACSSLKKGDIVHPSLRGRGQLLMMGISIREMMAGIFGRSTAYNAGRMPIRHMGDLSRGILLGSSVIGPGFAVSTGIALAFKRKGEARVILCFFGEGATSEGLFHESMNLAGVHRLPVVFVCENNRYAYTTPYERQVGARSIAQRARGYGFPGTRIDGRDVTRVYQTCKAAVDRARVGGGPSLIECMTHRFGPHTAWDHDRYRSEEEKKRIRRQCPIRRLGRRLRREGILDAGSDGRIRSEIQREIDEALASARKDPAPEWEDLFTHLYAESY